MNRKWFIRVLAILLAVLMAGSVLYGVIGSLTASAVSRNELNQLKEDQKLIQQRKKDIRSKINSLEYEQSSILAKKTVLDEQITLTEEEITNITEQINKYIALIAEAEKEVEKAEEREKNQLEAYKSRIRVMEENGAISYYAILFGASDFADLLSRIDSISEVMSSDEIIYNRLVQARLDTIAAKEALEEAKAEQEETRVELEERKAELDEQVEEASRLIAELEANLDQYQLLYSEVDVEDAKLQKQIDEMTEALRRQEQSGTGVKGTGTYIWPSQASRLVTSLFGTRLHPVYHVYKTHSGVDIGAAYGSNVLAADTGTVVTATYSSSYGYYVVLNHGGGNTTLYAHMSKIKVSVGETVTQGQVIGLVGSTGVSTGPHLHYEIRINGNRVNPLDYYSNYTISDSAY